MTAINRLLVANRGEIACRIMRCCRKMGIESVAVYSDADRLARHVREASIACRIGGPEPASSYLDARSIIDVALRLEVDAVHPGYGFLAESTELIRQCEQHGIVFVGPSLDCIREMGQKIEAKILARQLGIPTIPGYDGDSQDGAQLAAAALEIGFPVLVKASAGGGGKGMRIAGSAGVFAEMLAVARKEARGAFGDDRVLLEKFIQRPRHIEVQILGDSHGNCVHLFERECSIQRNYQKLVEEAPASRLDPVIRQRLYDAALDLGRHLGYCGAGTVEFILDADTGEFYFLEMNTRLQVEHPVTEIVTGIDLVEWQIRVASGESLAFSQGGLSLNGHAIEARVNAEDPANGYLPATGTVGSYLEPVGDGLRVDSGIEQGSHVTPYYDSMLAKLIASGENRQQATRRLVAGLQGLVIGGVKTNQDFLGAILGHPSFQDELSTRFLQEAFPEGWVALEEDTHRAVAAACFVYSRRYLASSQFAESPWRLLGGWRLTSPAGCHSVSRLWLREGADLNEITVADHGDCLRAGLRDGELRVAPGCSPEQGWVAEIDGVLHALDLRITGSRVHLHLQGRSRSYDFLGLEESHLGGGVGVGVAEISNSITAVMTGVVTDVPVKVGDRVCKGAILVVMEAMKMVHNLLSPCDATIGSVRCRSGASVSGGEILVEIRPMDPTDQPVGGEPGDGEHAQSIL